MVVPMTRYSKPLGWALFAALLVLAVMVSR
jgi:hypothetical protein